MVTFLENRHRNRRVLLVVVGPLRNMRRKTSSRFGLRFFCTKFRANRKTGRGFPPHVPQGTPAFLKITFQLHRNPTVLFVLLPVVVQLDPAVVVCSNCKIVSVTNLPVVLQVHECALLYVVPGTGMYLCSFLVRRSLPMELESLV